MLSCLTEMAVGRQSGRLASARLLMLLVASLAAARFHETDAALRPVSTGLDASLMPEMQRLGSLWPSARRKFRAAPLRLGLWGYVEVRPKAHMFW